MESTSNNNAGNDLVSRLLNVIVQEVLMSVDSRLNTHLLSVNNRLTELERKLELGGEAESSGLAARVRDLEERIEDTTTGSEFRDLESSVSDLESRLDDIDVEQAATDAVNDLDLTREVRDVLLGMNDEQAKEFVSKGLSSILTEANRI